MAAQNSQGIQTLLEAEKDAAKTVQRARQYRIQKLKDARTEAAKEIEELKARKNAELQAFEAEHTGNSDQSFARVAAETEVRLTEIQEAVQRHKHLVTERLFEAITTVNPKVHPNVRVDEQVQK